MKRPSSFVGSICTLFLLTACETFDFSENGSAIEESARIDARIEDPMLLQYPWCGVSYERRSGGRVLTRYHRMKFETSGRAVLESVLTQGGSWVETSKESTVCQSQGQDALECSKGGIHAYRFDGFDLRIDFEMGTDRFWPCSGDEEQRFP